MGMMFTTKLLLGIIAVLFCFAAPNLWWLITRPEVLAIMVWLGIWGAGSLLRELGKEFGPRWMSKEVSARAGWMGLFAIFAIFFALVSIGLALA